MKNVKIMFVVFLIVQKCFGQFGERLMWCIDKPMLKQDTLVLITHKISGITMTQSVPGADSIGTLKQPPALVFKWKIEHFNNEKQIRIVSEHPSKTGIITQKPVKIKNGLVQYQTWNLKKGSISFKLIHRIDSSGQITKTERWIVKTSSEAKKPMHLPRLLYVLNYYYKNDFLDYIIIDDYDSGDKRVFLMNYNYIQ